jgi:hypothetical protein
MQHDVERHASVGHMNGAQDRFRVVQVDVPHQRKTQEAHGLLTVDHQDEAGAALLLDVGDLAPPHGVVEPLGDHRLDGREEKEDP